MSRVQIPPVRPQKPYSRLESKILFCPKTISRTEIVLTEVNTKTAFYAAVFLFPDCSYHVWGIFPKALFY